MKVFYWKFEDCFCLYELIRMMERSREQAFAILSAGAKVVPKFLKDDNP